MKEGLPRLLPLLVNVGMVVLLVGCSATTPGKPPAASGSAATAPDAGNGLPAPDAKEAPGTSASAARNQVVIDNFTFSPATLTVSAGTKVTWSNHDDVPHTATSTAKPRVFDSRTLDTDEQFSFVFTTPGTYDYFCAVHPKMTGRIIVK
jgi:plastocyanin